MCTLWGEDLPWILLMQDALSTVCPFSIALRGSYEVAKKNNKNLLSTMQKVYKLHLDIEIMNSFRVTQKKYSLSSWTLEKMRKNFYLLNICVDLYLLNLTSLELTDSWLIDWVFRNFDELELRIRYQIHDFPSEKKNNQTHISIMAVWVSQ